MCDRPHYLARALLKLGAALTAIGIAIFFTWQVAFLVDLVGETGTFWMLAAFWVLVAIGFTLVAVYPALITIPIGTCSDDCSSD